MLRIVNLSMILPEMKSFRHLILNHHEQVIHYGIAIKKPLIVDYIIDNNEQQKARNKIVHLFEYELFFLQMDQLKSSVVKIEYLKGCQTTDMLKRNQSDFPVPFVLLTCDQ